MVVVLPVPQEQLSRILQGLERKKTQTTTRNRSIENSSSLTWTESNRTVLQPVKAGPTISSTGRELARWSVDGWTAYVTNSAGLQLSYDCENQWLYLLSVSEDTSYSISIDSYSQDNTIVPLENKLALDVNKALFKAMREGRVIAVSSPSSTYEYSLMGFTKTSNRLISENPSCSYPTQ